MTAADFRFGFRVLGDCRQPRRLVDAAAALAGYAACDASAECQRESYLSAFQYAADFRAHLSATGSTAGFSGPCWAAYVWSDIDRPEDLGAALDDTRRLCGVVTEAFHVADDDVLVFYSGAKGFHVGFPTSLWQPPPGRDFHRIARRFVELLAERAGATVDAGVFDRVRCFRAPNSRHPRTGRHKRRLAVGELMALRSDAILALAAEPAEFDLPATTYRSEAAAATWAEAAEAVDRDAKSAADRAEALADGMSGARLNRSTLDFIREGASEPNRHRLLYSAAANLAELGAPLALCGALLETAALDCGLPPGDVRRAIENAWREQNGGAK